MGGGQFHGHPVGSPWSLTNVTMHQCSLPPCSFWLHDGYWLLSPLWCQRLAEPTETFQPVGASAVKQISIFRSFIALVAVLIVVTEPLAAADRTRNRAASVSYEADVRPILKANCFHCHGEGDEVKGGLDLRLRRLIVDGGESGGAIVPGSANDSLLYQYISAGEMPPETVGKRLTGDEIRVIRQWINAGAATIRSEPDQIGEGTYYTEEERSFWFFQPIQPVDPLQVKNAGEVSNPIDQFLLARLEEEGLAFSPRADRITLIRRVYFDLLGFPPTPEQVTDFIANKSPDAYFRLVDQLLASPHYGERWGRHWLDVAGYADSEGVTDEDPVRPHAFRYRDWVIRSVDVDMPLDQFVLEQLAGDELIGRDLENLTPREVDMLTATGFLRMAPDGTGTGGLEQDAARNAVISETIKIVSTGLLGLTVGCAQCHNHRYDPIQQADYYRFRALFEPGLDWQNWIAPQSRQVTLLTDADRKRAAEIEAEAKLIEEERTKKQEEYVQQTFEKELAKLPEELREPIMVARNTSDKDRTEDQKKLLMDHPSVNVTAGSLYLYDQKAADDLKIYVDQATAKRRTKPEERLVRAFTEPLHKDPPTTFVFKRGDHNQPGQQVQPGELTIVQGNHPLDVPVNDESLPSTGRRLAYARWLTSSSHPLFSRVLVNRIWMNHFGRGIVNTPGDFGFLGERPTHPELLDWLAGRLINQDWSLKQMHRLMMFSTAYQQSSMRTLEADAVDADNRLLSRMTVRRLDAETLRDSVLVVNGQLNVHRFGPPVPVMADRVGQFVIGIENLNAGRPGPVLDMKGEDLRRSVFVQVRRSRPLGTLSTFDMATPEPNCTIRSSSTVAPQALMMMNGRFIRSQSITMAERIKDAVGDDLAAQVKLAWCSVYSRDPTEQEQADAIKLVEQLGDHFREAIADPGKETGNVDNLAEPNTSDDPKVEALATLCQALLGSNEFLYVR